MKMNSEIQQIELSKLPPNDQLEGPEPSNDLCLSIKTYGIIYPIILSKNGRKLTLVDGRRRIKAARILEYETISAIVYTGLSLDDTATWALILNEQRSTNVITEYLYYTQLMQDKEWSTLRVDYGFNKQHVQKILSLSKIDDFETLSLGYQKGLLSENTLFEVAKLDKERQKYISDVLVNKGKLTMSDVKEAKKVNKLQAMNKLPRLEAVERAKLIEDNPYSFAVQLEDNQALLCKTLEEAYEQNDFGKRRIFRIFEV